MLAQHCGFCARGNTFWAGMGSSNLVARAGVARRAAALCVPLHHAALARYVGTRRHFCADGAWPAITCQRILSSFLDLSYQTCYNLPTSMHYLYGGMNSLNAMLVEEHAWQRGAFYAGTCVLCAADILKAPAAASRHPALWLFPSPATCTCHLTSYHSAKQAARAAKQPVWRRRRVTRGAFSGQSAAGPACARKVLVVPLTRFYHAPSPHVEPRRARRRDTIPPYPPTYPSYHFQFRQKDGASSCTVAHVWVLSSTREPAE